MALNDFFWRSFWQISLGGKRQGGIDRNIFVAFGKTLDVKRNNDDSLLFGGGVYNDDEF